MPELFPSIKELLLCFFLCSQGNGAALFMLSDPFICKALHLMGVCLHIFIEMLSCTYSRCHIGFSKQTHTYAKLCRPTCVRKTCLSVRFNLASA